MIVRIDPRTSIRTREGLQELCKDCSLYGRRDTCPPNVPLLENFFDYEKDMFAVYRSFNVKEFGERVLEVHPNLDEQEAYRPRRWQAGIRRQNRKEAEEYMEGDRKLWYTGSPEGHGVDISFLMKEGMGIDLSWEGWPPSGGLIYMVGLMGNRLDGVSWFKKEG